MRTKPFFEKPKIATTHVCCRICGRMLKDPKSVSIGIGPVCLARETRRIRTSVVINSKIIPRLFDLEEITDVEENRDRKLPKS